MGKRKRYTLQYRREAAALVLDTDRPIAHVAKEIEVGAQVLGRWVTQERERRDPPPGPDAAEREELKQLRRRGYDLERDNEFLGKAAAFFASKHPGGTVRVDAEQTAGTRHRRRRPQRAARGGR